jgi:hypothetical protein
VDFELLCSLQVFGESLVVGVSSGRGSAWAAAPAAVASFAPAVFWRRSDTVCWEQHAARALTKKSQAWPPQVAEGPLLRRCCGRLFPHRVSSPRTGRAEPLPLLTRQSSSRASGAHRCGLVFPAPNSLEPRFYPFHVGSFKGFPVPRFATVMPARTETGTGPRAPPRTPGRGTCGHGKRGAKSLYKSHYNESSPSLKIYNKCVKSRVRSYCTHARSHRTTHTRHTSHEEPNRSTASLLTHTLR